MSIIEKDIPLKKYSNYKIGGPARFFLNFKNINELHAGLKEWQEIAQKEDIDLDNIFILGGGTNILFADQGYNGLVIHNSIKFIDRKDLTISAGAGISIEELNNYYIDNSLSGMEWSGGLPGTLGGAIFGNAGAFGGETKDDILSVQSYDIKSGKVITRTNKECTFGYRNSIFKAQRLPEIILSADLEVQPGNQAAIKQAVQEKIGYRQSHQPLEYPNAGSTFKNIDVKLCPPDLIEKCQSEIKTDPFPVIPIAYLIHLAGLSGTKINDAQISTKHPNFIINTGNASAKDVGNLIALVKQELYNQFGIKPESEIINLTE